MSFGGPGEEVGFQPEVKQIRIASALAKSL